MSIFYYIHMNRLIVYKLVAMLSYTYIRSFNEVLGRSTQLIKYLIGFIERLIAI